jgi:hypothetical protein
MKRWNFKGMPASHGNSVSHRRPGSIGMREFPGHVWKGKKMAGNMGNERITVQNLMVARIDERYSLLYLKGAVPGIIGSRVVLRDAIKMHMKQNKIVPFPTFIADPAKKYEAIENAPDPLLDSLELRRNDNTLIEGIDDEEMESLMDEDPDVKK